jgi:hypothetical protein
MSHRCALLWRQVEVLSKVVDFDEFILWINALRINVPRRGKLRAGWSPKEQRRVHEVSIKRLHSSVSKNILHCLRAETLAKEDEARSLFWVHTSQITSDCVHECTVLVYAKFCPIERQE